MLGYKQKSGLNAAMCCNCHGIFQISHRRPCHGLVKAVECRVFNMWFNTTVCCKSMSESDVSGVVLSHLSAILPGV